VKVDNVLSVKRHPQPHHRPSFRLKRVVEIKSKHMQHAVSFFRRKEKGRCQDSYTEIMLPLFSLSRLFDDVNKKKENHFHSPTQER